MQAAANESQQILASLQGDDGGMFIIAGKSYAGTPSAEMQGQTLQLGGRLVTIEKTIAVTADQFTGPPVIGSLVLHASTTYKLIHYSRDGLHFLLFLETPNQ